RGKKSIAEGIVYGAFEKLAEKSVDESDSNKDSSGTKASKSGGIRLSAQARSAALRTFEKALDNVRPAVEVKSRRVGGANYQVPVEIRPDRRLALAMRWLVEYASQRGEKTMDAR